MINCFLVINLYSYCFFKTHHSNKVIKIPATIAEPMVLETIGPIACINRWLCGLYSNPSLWETRAAIGIADTPELPISGFTFPPVSLSEDKFQVQFLYINRIITLHHRRPKVQPMGCLLWTFQKLVVVIVVAHTSSLLQDKPVKGKQVS